MPRSIRHRDFPCNALSKAHYDAAAAAIGKAERRVGRNHLAFSRPTFAGVRDRGARAIARVARGPDRVASTLCLEVGGPAVRPKAEFNGRIRDDGLASALSFFSFSIGDFHRIPADLGASRYVAEWP